MNELDLQDKYLVHFFCERPDGLQYKVITQGKGEKPKSTDVVTVHYEGKGTAGVYPRDIAETKANQVNNYARSQGHPLLCQIEPKA